MAGKVSSDPNVFLLPDVGEGLESADLVEWCVKVGDAVKENDLLAKVETAKALTDIFCPRDGVIKTLHGNPGDTIKVFAPFVTFEGSSSASAHPDNGKSLKSLAPGRKETQETEEREDAGTVVGSLSGKDYSAVEGKVRAAPAVRRMARDLGVDIETVRGTGIGGRITMRDVENASAGRARVVPSRPTPGRVNPDSSSRQAPKPVSRPAPSIPQGQDSVRIPFKGIRRVIADRLSQSVQTAVHFTVMDDADITELDVLRRRLISATGEKLSYLPFVAIAVCKALRESDFSRLNSLVDDKSSEIVTYRSIHLGIATDTENGLMVPVIRSADQLTVTQISQEIARLARTARDRTIPQQDLTGGTFTISNVGSLAGRYATPIINYPEVGILAVGRARDGMVVRGRMFGVGKLLPLSMSCDHRVIDGGLAALMLARVIELLQSPDQLIPAE